MSVGCFVPVKLFTKKGLLVGAVVFESTGFIVAIGPDVAAESILVIDVAKG
jgi:hypothetical protein